MLHYAKYLLSPVILAIHLAGLWAGAAYVWSGLAVVLGLLLFDAFLERDFSCRDTRYPWLYDTIISITILMGFGQIFLYAYLAGNGHFTTTASAVGAFIGTAIIGFVLVAPCVHELFHRENTLLRWYGRLAQCLIMDPWREITHVVTHHMSVATPDDPDYGRRGDTIYGHMYRSISAQIKDAYHLERMMWTKRGRRWWHPANGWWPKMLSLGIFAAALYALGGMQGMLLAAATCLLGPRLLLEVFNYVGHYGLICANPGHFERRHTWNHLSPLVRILALEITNHAGHHEDSYKPFYELVPDRDGPQQPQFLMCVLLSLVPPLWFMTIKPLLKHWDAHYATPQEREIARRENARAGWDELNEPGYRAVGSVPV